MIPENASLSAETLYEALVESLPLSVFQKDRQLRILFANQRFCDGLGRSLNEIRGHSDFDLFPQELADKYRRDDLSVMESGTLLEDIEEMIDATGRRRYIQVLKTPMRDAAGQIVGVQGMFWDISDRIVAEMRLRETLAFLDSIVDNVPIMLFVKDAEQLRFVRFNRASEDLVGIQRADVLGKNDFDLFPPDEAALFTQQDRAVLTGGTMLDIPEEVIDTRNHGKRILHTKKIPVLDASRQPQYLLGISEDITERKQAELDLREAKVAAEAASRAKSDFLANMSHEIRTPLNAVLGLAELLLDTSLSKTQRDYLRLVHESGETLLSLINDILDFSKIEAGKMLLDSVAFNLQEILGDTMKTLSVRAARKDLELALHVIPDVPHLLVGDPGRVRQIVINLIGNALKFTDRGEVVLEVQCKHRTTDEVELLFQVRDTGIGIPADKLDRIFEAFEQADTSTTRRYGGTGLGLTITSRLIHLMGGRIWVESTLDKGSTFFFTARFGTSAQEVISPAENSVRRLRGTRVLVVDDNATNRLILREIVENHGLLPATAAGAVEARQMLLHALTLKQPFELLLTDVNMPQVDGFTLVEWIRRDVQLRDMAVIVLTSGDRTDDQTRCETLGIGAYLRKPIKQSELMQAIVLVLELTSPEPDHPVLPHEVQSVVPPLRILLAEDSYPNQVLAKGLLGKRGHTVTLANTGREAVELLERQPFDLILMDVQMPEMDGLEATRTIRRLEAEGELVLQPSRPIPIVAMTAHAMKGDRERCLASGMNEYVSKPIHNLALDEVLVSLFSSSGTGPRQTDQGTCEMVINWTEALQSVDGDCNLLRVVARVFLSEAGDHQAKIAAAIEACDAVTLQRVSHVLKGVLGTFGATDCCALVERLENIGRQADFADAATCFQQFQQQFRLVTDALAAFVDGGLDPQEIVRRG